MSERVGKEYWDSNWQAEARLPDAFDPTVRGARGLFRRPFHRFFAEHLPDVAAPGSSLIEIGCGRSQFLPYFAKYFGLQVSGLDYSPVGCENARRILERERIKGKVFCGDLWTFDVPAPGYDVVFSCGLVEHFDDTAAIICALARFLRPGGALLTVVPNMRGVVGALQKALSQEIYDIHVPLSAADLARAYTKAGLSLRSSGYLLPAHFGVCNPGTLLNASGVSARMRDLAYHGAIATSTVLLWINERIVHIPATEWMSPYAFVLATKPGEDFAAAASVMGSNAAG